MSLFNFFKKDKKTDTLEIAPQPQIKDVDYSNDKGSNLNSNDVDGTIIPDNNIKSILPLLEAILKKQYEQPALKLLLTLSPNKLNLIYQRNNSPAALATNVTIYDVPEEFIDKLIEDINKL